MATGDAWHESDDPPKVGYPWAWFDPDATIDVPYDITDWMAKLASAYASHVMVTDDNLQAVTSAYSSNVITARIAKSVAGVLVTNKKYGFTYRVTCADGQIDDRTLYFRIKEL